MRPAQITHVHVTLDIPSPLPSYVSLVRLHDIFFLVLYISFAIITLLKIKQYDSVYIIKLCMITSRILILATSFHNK